MRIGMLIFALCAGKGGAERAAVNIAAGLAGRGHECVLLYAAKNGSSPAYTLPLTVRAVNLDVFAPTAAWLEHARRLITAERLDALLVFNSTSFGSNYVVLCRGLHIPLVWSEHNVPQIIETERWNRSERLACMAASDAIALLCRGFVSSLPQFLQKRAMVIPNFSHLAPANAPTPRRSRKRILTVARLYESAKQLSVLLRAVALLKGDFSDWEWRICGDGPSKKFYEELSSALGINAYVTLAGNMDDIAAEYAAADFFVLPSRHEGFPLSLLEAQKLGLPAIGFAGCSGVNEIIVHGENGLLISDMTAESLADGMRTLMVDAALRSRMGARAQELSSRYDAERVLDQWENLFRDVIRRSCPVALDLTDTVEDPDICRTLRVLLDTPLGDRSQSETKDLCKAFRDGVRNDFLLRRLRLLPSTTDCSGK